MQEEFFNYVISIKDAAIAEVIKEGSQIKFKDRYENTSALFTKDIYQIDDLIVNQR